MDSISFSHSAPASRLGMGKRLGGDTARTAVPDWSKGYSMPYNLMARHKDWCRGRRGWEFFASKVAVAQRLAGH